MKRREFITLLGGAAAASSLSCLRTGRAQPAGKVYRIGILETNSPLTNAANFDALRKGMMELADIKAKLFFEYRSADGRNERFPDLVAELVQLKVEGAHRAEQRPDSGKSPTNRRPRGQASIARHLCIQGICGRGRADDIRSELPPSLSTRSDLR